MKGNILNPFDSGMLMVGTVGGLIEREKSPEKKKEKEHDLREGGGGKEQGYPTTGRRGGRIVPKKEMKNPKSPVPGGEISEGIQGELRVVNKKNTKGVSSVSSCGKGHGKRQVGTVTKKQG